MNTEAVALLLKARASILAEPAQFIMKDVYADEMYLSYSDLPRSIPNCGHAACIAGWMVAHDSRKTPQQADELFMDPYDKAVRLLGLIKYEADELFNVEKWPLRFLTRWIEAKELDARAQIAAERIDAFIEEYGPNAQTPDVPRTE